MINSCRVRAMNINESRTPSSEDAKIPVQHVPRLLGRAGVVIWIAVLLVVAYWTALYLVEKKDMLEGSVRLFCLVFSRQNGVDRPIFQGLRLSSPNRRSTAIVRQWPSSDAAIYAWSLHFGAFHTLALLPYPTAVLLWYIANAVVLIAIPCLLRKSLRLTNNWVAVAILSLAFSIRSVSL